VRRHPQTPRSDRCSWPIHWGKPHPPVGLRASGSTARKLRRRARAMGRAWKQMRACARQADRYQVTETEGTIAAGTAEQFLPLRRKSLDFVKVR